jgi:Fungal domain of unknown function (DUF1750)
MVEMWLHRGGYHWPNEAFTAHCRKRYRLTQSKNSNAPPCDPSLWIIHYSRADRDNIIPSNQLPLQPVVAAALSQRRFLQSQGHLARKEFMLHDKANWPTISLPPQGLQYPPHMMARQQAAVATQMQMGATPNKSIPDRHQHRRGPSNVLEPTLEDEEDVSRGDMLDFMTPRDISRMRYEQHHEWMEEIMSSPFAMKQIVPTDLGLGRKGELEALTSGFFDTPTSVLPENPANASSVKVGRMDISKAEEFTAKAAKKVAEMEAELEKLKKRHARRMAKLDRSMCLSIAEKKLRTITAEGVHQSLFAESEEGSRQEVAGNADEIVRDIETALGKKIVPVTIVQCVEKGGLEETVQTPVASTTNGQPSPGTAMDEREASKSNSEKVDSSERGIPSSMQQQALSGPDRAPPSLSLSRNNIDQAQEPVAEDTIMDEPVVPSLAEMDVDVEMAGLESENPGAGASIGENDGSEWVLVDDVNASTAEEALAAEGPAPNENGNEDAEQTSQSLDPGAAAAGHYTHTASGSGIQGLTPVEPSGAGAGEGEGVTEADFDLGQEGFDENLGDPGHDLVDFGDDHGDLNLEGMDDSAFGDAFHPPDEGQANLPEHGDIS